MLAYNNDPELRQRCIDLAVAHREADTLIKGQYAPDEEDDDFKGGAVGCTLYTLTGDVEKADDHSLYPSVVGLPEWLAHLQDGVFEGLSNDLAMSWPERFFETISAGAEIGDAVRHGILSDILDLQVGKHSAFPKVETSLINCRDLHLRAIAEPVSDDDWSAARAAARAAAESAAWSAAASAAESAAESAAWSAARSAARAAAWSAAWSAAESAAWEDISQIVLRRLATT